MTTYFLLFAFEYMISSILASVCLGILFAQTILSEFDEWKVRQPRANPKPGREEVILFRIYTKF